MAEGQCPGAGGPPPVLAPETIMGQSKSEADEFINFSEVEHPREGKNKLFLVCEHCKCRVISPGYAAVVEKELFMPNMTGKHKIGTQPEGDTLTLFWLVEDMFHFENIGFSKVVSGCEQYLVCADCEIGPIGWTNINEKNKFFVATERVKYANS